MTGRRPGPGAGTLQGADAPHVGQVTRRAELEVDVVGKRFGHCGVDDVVHGDRRGPTPGTADPPGEQLPALWAVRPRGRESLLHEERLRGARAQCLQCGGEPRHGRRVLLRTPAEVSDECRLLPALHRSRHVECRRGDIGLPGADGQRERAADQVLDRPWKLVLELVHGGLGSAQHQMLRRPPLELFVDPMGYPAVVLHRQLRGVPVEAADLQVRVHPAWRRIGRSLEHLDLP